MEQIEEEELLPLGDITKATEIPNITLHHPSFLSSEDIARFSSVFTKRKLLTWICRP